MSIYGWIWFAIFGIACPVALVFLVHPAFAGLMPLMFVLGLQVFARSFR